MNIKYENNNVCSECAKGKHVKFYFKPKSITSTSRPFELVHIDLRGPMWLQFINGHKFVCVVVDDFYKFTWVIFLHSKYETFSEFVALMKQV